MTAPDQIVDSYHFKLVRKLADGGMGSVYDALLYGAEGFEKQVAIKTIREKFTADKDFVGLFIGEAKLVADLVHQNIVQIYKLGKVGNSYYIAMEYVQGINLAQYIHRHMERDEKLPVTLTAFIASRVCRGLEYAHDRADRAGNPLNVVHRDINPKNIMISSEGEVKITDFGIAKARNLMRDREGEVLMGKIQYMSPEQAQFQPTDRRSDIFSLGIVLYELLVGHNIFDTGADTTAIMNNIIYKDIPKPRERNPDIPEGLEMIILKSLERNVHRRYQDAGEMGYDLELFLYKDGYGPTIQTLERHLRERFPELYRNQPAKKTPGRQATPLLPPDAKGTTMIVGEEKNR